MEKLSQLTELDVSNTQLTGPDVASLFRKLPKCAIRHSSWSDAVDFIALAAKDDIKFGQSWEIKGDSIESRAVLSTGLQRHPLVAFPIPIDGNYDLHATVTRTDTDFDVGIVLPVGQSHVRLVMSAQGVTADGKPLQIYGLDAVGEKNVFVNSTRREGTALPKTPVDVFVKVRTQGSTASIEAKVGNLTEIQWEGNTRELDVHEFCRPASKRVLAITSLAPSRWEKLSVRVK